MKNISSLPLISNKNITSSIIRIGHKPCTIICYLFSTAVPETSNPTSVICSYLQILSLLLDYAPGYVNKEVNGSNPISVVLI